MIETTMKKLMGLLKEYGSKMDEIQECRNRNLRNMLEELEELEEDKTTLEREIREETISLIKEAAQLLKDVL
jgi:DNA repair ATPase RecN